MKFSIGFKCPKCDSRYFGSSGVATGPLVRHCSDQNERGCEFSFPVSDDWKYFVGIIEFENKEEFENADEIGILKGYKNAKKQKTR